MCRASGSIISSIRKGCVSVICCARAFSAPAPGFDRNHGKRNRAALYVAQACHLLPARRCLAFLAARRFYMVRFAAALGELRGFLDRARGPSPPSGQAPASGFDPVGFARWLAIALLVAALALVGTSHHAASSLGAAIWVALLCTTALVLKSFYDFSQTGPPLKDGNPSPLQNLLRARGGPARVLGVPGMCRHGFDRGLALRRGVALAQAPFRSSGAIAAAVRRC